MIIKLAWRNIWRNKRRTGITLGSIFFAVILSVFMMSIKEGVYDNMIKSSAGDFSGYAQVHLKGYWDDRSFDYAFDVSDSLVEAIEANTNISGYLPRIESFALVAGDEITKGSMVIGIDPEKEKAYTKLHERVVEGTYFTDNASQILIGQGLAEYLKVGVNDTLVLLGSGYMGMTAVGKYSIAGIVKFGSPELSNRLVFLPMEAADYFFASNGLVTSIILQCKDGDAGRLAAQTLGQKLGDEYEVMDWIQLNPELLQMIETDRVEGYVFMFILYLVIGFGIFGTMLMMLVERAREFGVLIAVGMKRMKLAFMVWFEVLTLSILGAILGIIGAFPLCLYFNINPIRYSEEMAQIAEEYGIEAVLRASLDPGIFIQQAVVIAIMASVIAIYPFFKLTRINAVESMRS